METIALFFATSGHSGVDRAMQNLIPELARRGYPVDLLHVRKHGPTLKEHHERVNLIDLGTSHTYTSLPALVRYLRKHRPAVMLSDKDRVNRTALAARWLARVPTRLVLSYGTTASINLAKRGPFERWLQRTSMGRLYPFADNVIVTSEGVADDMSRYTGLARRHIEVVPSPVIPDSLLEAEPEVPDHPWFRDREVPLIISVGELSERKDFATLLRGFARLRAQRPCRLMILGRGKRRERLLKLAEELGISEDLALPGFVDSPYAYMAHADLFTFTSRWEGLGFVIIEALAMGTPVVSTDCPSGPSEILQQGRYGRLVPIGDPEALAAAMADSLDHPLSAETLREAVTPYTVSAATDSYLKALGLI
jgi:glycosyltransferase involved in cell wall biosynthesis